MIVDGPMRPQFHTLGRVIIRIIVFGIVPRHIRGIPSGNSAGVPLEVRFYDFTNLWWDGVIVVVLVVATVVVRVAAAAVERPAAAVGDGAAVRAELRAGAGGAGRGAADVGRVRRSHHAGGQNRSSRAGR